MPRPVQPEAVGELWTFTIFAGTSGSSGTNDGTGSNARFNHPQGIALDPQGIVFVADTRNSSVRKITPAGEVSTFAGGYRVGRRGNQELVNAQLSNPYAIALDGSGIIYVASYNIICKITPDGVVSTLAGNAGGRGSRDGRGIAARFIGIQSVSVDADGSIYVADTDYNSNLIRRITPRGEVSTMFGGSVTHFAYDGVAGFNPRPRPRRRGGPTGDVYVADFPDHTIRKVTPDGVVSTLAGQSGRPGHADGTANNALFDLPQAIRLDGDGSLLILDRGAHTIRRITPAGAVSTVADFGDNVHDANGASAAGTFRDCTDFALDKEDNIYIADAGDNIILKGVRRPGQPKANVESKSQPANVSPQAPPARGINRNETVHSPNIAGNAGTPGESNSHSNKEPIGVAKRTGVPAARPGQAFPRAFGITSMVWAGEDFQPRYLGELKVNETLLGRVNGLHVQGLAFHPDGRIGISVGYGTTKGMGLYYWNPQGILTSLVALEYKHITKDVKLRETDEAAGKFWFFAGILTFDPAGTCYFSLGPCDPNGIYKVVSSAPVVIDEIRPSVPHQLAANTLLRYQPLPCNSNERHISRQSGQGCGLE